MDADSLLISKGRCQRESHSCKLLNISHLKFQLDSDRYGFYGKFVNITDVCQGPRRIEISDNILLGS